MEYAKRTFDRYLHFKLSGAECHFIEMPMERKALLSFKSVVMVIKRVGISIFSSKRFFKSERKKKQMR